MQANQESSEVGSGGGQSNAALDLLEVQIWEDSDTPVPGASKGYIENVISTNIRISPADLVRINGAN